ncbi:MAG: glycosyltransferase, partial [Bacteroidales bacterium]|nr:glycosyltransferase [Bacteroidales bacterium]
MDRPLRILALLPRIPWPLEKGDKLRAYHQLRELARRHEVHVWALSDVPVPRGAREALEQHFASITFSRLSKISILSNLTRAGIQGRPFQAGYFFNSRVRSGFREYVSRLRPDALYFQLARTAWYAEGLTIPAVLDLQDAFSAGLQRRLSRAAWYQRPFIAEEMRRMGQYENKVCDAFRYITIISEEDRALIPHPGRDKIVVVPNGVETGYFQPVELPKKHHLVFTGNMG